MSSSDTLEHGGDLLANIGDEAAALRAFAKKLLDVPEDTEPPAELVSEGLTALSKIYAVRFQLGERSAPLTDVSVVPPTVAMIMATAMLRAVNVELFELGMWQSWSGA